MKRHIVCCVLVAAMCLFVCSPVFAAEQNPTGETSYTQTFYLDGLTSSNSMLVGYITASLGYAYQDYFFTGQSSTYFKDVIYSLYVYNYNDYPVYINSQDLVVTIAPKFDDTYAKPRLTKTTPISGELILTRVSGNTHYFKAAAGYNLTNKIYIPAKGHVMCVWQQQLQSSATLNSLTVIGFNATWSSPAIPITYYDASDLYPSYESYLAAIADGMLAHEQESASLETQSGDVTSDLQSQHTQEQSYYQQSTQAMTDIGIDNWSIDNFQGEGISFAGNTFTMLWNALGPFSWLITFGLLLKFATMVLRHRASGGE